MKKIVLSLCFIFTIGVSVNASETATRNYLCFIAEEANATVRLDKDSNLTNVNLQYALNDTTAWYDYSWNAYKGDILSMLNIGDRVYFRAKGSNSTFSSSIYDARSYYYFVIDKKVRCEGNIMSLLDETCEQVSVPQYAFAHLFENCKTLTTAPQLPATTLADGCYSYMFEGCTSLTNAPQLPATTLAEKCYARMFNYCTSLTNAPELPATTLAESCYYSMFFDCSSLTTAPELPATTLADSCYLGMFIWCTSLTTAPELPATTLAESCYLSMFRGCTSLTNAPQLQAPILASSCYCSMFLGCTSLTNAPELPATTLAEYCYYGMFRGCTSLTNAPQLQAPILASSCYCSMFSGCTSLTNAPELPATTLANRCYAFMFSGCTSLTNAPELPATTLAEYCYYGMFLGCTSLTNAPELPATTLANGCYCSMFSGCTSLTNAPELPATILADSCYQSMFRGCRNLNNIKVHFTSWEPSGTSSWMDGIAGNGVFTAPCELEDIRGVSYIPEGWTFKCYSTTDSDSICHSVHLYATAGGRISSVNLYSGDTIISSDTLIGKCTPETLRLYALPEEGYHFVRWSDGNTDESRRLAVWENMTEDSLIAIFEPIQTESSTRNYLCFIAEEAEAIVRLDAIGSPAEVKLQYALNDTNAWYDYSWNAYKGDTLFMPNIGDKVYFRAKGSNKTFSSSNRHYRFVIDKKVRCEGNIMSLLDETCEQVSVPQYAFAYLFNDCYTLTSAPQLPATTLWDMCYAYMFSGCESLTTAPELPATTLAESCYYSMFRGCTSLTNAPQLQAPILASSCYCSMFSGCESLTNAPQLPATTLAGYCYGAMFKGCTSLTNAPELPATTLADMCYAYMFSGCESLTNAPELPATTLAGACYGSMFSGCTSLTKAPQLPATTLAESCYEGMFSGCESLTNAPELPATTLADMCYAYMFSGCESLTNAPELPATTLVESCYESMFAGCRNLNNIKVHFTSWGAFRCSMWLSSVAGNGVFTAPCELEDKRGASYIPEGWTFKCQPTTDSDSICHSLHLSTNPGGRISSVNLYSGDTIISRDTLISKCTPETLRLCALPDEGYHFAHWNDGDTTNPRTISLTQDTNLIAFFGRDIVYYRLTTQTADSLMGTVTGGGIYPENEQVTISAIAKENYQFVEWSDGNTTNPRTLTLTNDTNITAKFELILMSSNLAMIYLKDTPIMNFVPDNYSYIFKYQAGTRAEDLPMVSDISWTLSDQYQTVNIWQTGTTIILNVTSGRGLTKTYLLSFLIEVPNQYTVTTLSNNDAWGTVIGGNTYNAGTQVSIGAFAKEGYQFYHWNNTITENPYSFTLTQDTSFVALFLPNTAEDIISDVTSNSVHMEWEVKPWGIHGYWVWIYTDRDHRQWFCKMRFTTNGELDKFYWGPASKHYDDAKPNTVSSRYFFRSPAKYVVGATDIISYDLTDLDASQDYYYTVEGVDVTEEVVSVQAGTFTTESQQGSALIDLTGDKTKCQTPYKVFSDGQIFILRGDRRYTILGQEIQK